MDPPPTVHSDYYLLTITYEKPWKLGAVTQFRAVTRPLVRLLSKCSRNFKAYPELQVNGNLHWHVILTVFDRIKLYKEVLPTLRKEGFIKFEKVKDYMNVLEYCSKDVAFMSVYLDMTPERLPISQSHLTQILIEEAKAVNELD